VNGGAPVDGIEASTVSLWVGGAVVALLAFGLHWRRRPRIHVPIMLTCLAADLANVAWIEVRRAAVEKAMAAMTDAAPAVLRLHIAASLVAGIAYAVALATGLRLLGKRPGRRAHRANAAVLLTARAVNFVTSLRL
jgi:hypothetical protein